MPYSVKAIFDTYQGEGARAGRRSVFLRMAGCNLWNGRESKRDTGIGACSAWCDTDFADGERLTVQEIVSTLEKAWPLPKDAPPTPRWVVITGGEPLLQVDATLTKALHDAGWGIAVETNGTVSLGHAAEVDWVTVSPKLARENKAPLPLAIKRATEVKFVLSGDDIGEWRDDDILRIADQLNASYRYVQPLDPAAQVRSSRLVTAGLGPGRVTQAISLAMRASVARCIAFCQRHPEWTLGIQMQKVLGFP